MTDQFERGEHDLDCTCPNCVEHDSECGCEHCYEQRVIEANRARTEYIWAANQAANERMANLVGGFDDSED